MKFATFTSEKIILNLREPSYGMKLSKVIGVCYSNLSRIISDLEKDGILKKVEGPNRRTKLIELTEKGKKIRNLLVKLKELE